MVWCVCWLVAVDVTTTAPPEAVISVLVRAAAQRGRLERLKDFKYRLLDANTPW